MNYFSSPETWIVVVVTLLVVTLCITLHFEVLSRAPHVLHVLTAHRRRRVLAFIILILITHIVEIWLFAAGYYAMVVILQIGDLTGLSMDSFPDYVYYSAMVFTTVGFGDVLPTGAIRFMSGMEALTGLVMITWSASYTFLEMQQDWSTRK